MPSIEATPEDQVPGSERLDDDSDVSAVSTRRLVLRAVNSTLRLEHAVGQLTTEVSGCRGDIHALRTQDGGFRKELDSVPTLVSESAHAEIAKLEFKLDQQRRESAEAILKEKLSAYREADEERKKVIADDAKRAKDNRDARRNGYLIAFVTVVMSIASTYAVEEMRHAEAHHVP